MGFLSFLGRNLAAAVVGALGIIALVLGYADQAANIWAAVEPWKLQAFGATLFVLAVILILYKWDQEHQQKNDPRPAPLKPMLATAAPASPAVWQPAKETARRDPDGSNRVFVGENVTPTFLRGLYQAGTEIQGERAIQPYLNKWMTVTGQVRDISRNSTYYSVLLDMLKPSDASYLEVISATMLQFPLSEEKVAILHKGDEITVHGQISRVDGMGLVIGNCELA